MLALFILLIAGTTFLIVVLVVGQGSPGLARNGRVFDYALGLFVLAVACFLPAFLLIWFIHSYAISTETTIEVFSEFDPVPAKWEQNIENEDNDLVQKNAEELEESGLPDDVIPLIQDLMWIGWPLVAAVLLLFFFVGFRALAGSHRMLLRDVEADAHCPPGSVDSYVGLPTLPNPSEHETWRTSHAGPF